MSSCFSAWSKRLAQRRFHSLSAAAAGVQQHMQSLEGMFDTQLAAVAEERDALRESLRGEQDKVRGGALIVAAARLLESVESACVRDACACRWRSCSSARAA